MNEVFLYSLLLVLSVIISSFSQIMLKASALKKHRNVVFEYINFTVITAYFIYFVAIFLDILALKKVPVSYIPVIESSSYIFILILSRIFFKEEIPPKKFLAVCIIITGITIYIL